MKKKIVYIISAVHSGSTFLTKLLGQHQNIFAGGELMGYNNELSAKAFCSCEEYYINCVFWNKVKDEISIDNLNISREIKSKNKLLNSIKFSLLLLFGLKFNFKVRNIINNYLDFYDTIFKVSNANIIVDSSKNFVTALILARFLKHDFNFIYLHRDGRAVLNSYQKKKYNVNLKSKNFKQNRNIPKPLIIINSWRTNNLYGILLLIFRNKKTKKVSYENLVKDPLRELIKLNNFIDICTNKSQLTFDKEDHIFGGNSSRINTKKVEKRDVAQWKENLDKDLLNKFNKKSGWLNVILGYK